MEKYIGPDIEITKLTIFFSLINFCWYDLIQGWGKFTSKKSLNIPNSNGSNEGEINNYVFLCNNPNIPPLFLQVILPNFDPTPHPSGVNKNEHFTYYRTFVM